MNIIISAFIYLSTNSSKSLESYIEQGIKLLKLDIQKIIFISDNVFDYFEKYQNNKTILIKTRLDDLYLYKYKEQLKDLHVNTNNILKDTFEYFVIQCNKTEWMREGIFLSEATVQKQFIWLDFGIHHVLSDTIITDECFQQNSNKIRIPSIWNLEINYSCDVKRDILWYFAGGVFGGSAEKVIEFADLVKTKCLEMIEKECHLMWEVNIWYLVWTDNKDLFDVYKADHDSSLMRGYHEGISPSKPLSD